MNSETYKDLVAQMSMSIQIGQEMEEEGFLPQFSEEHRKNLAAWLIGEGWEKK